MIRVLWLAGLGLSSVLARAEGKAARSVPQCAGVTLSASYLAAIPQGPGFHFTVKNETGHAIRLVEPVPSSAHWYARVGGRWLWRASGGAGGGLAEATRTRGPLFAYPAGTGAVLTVPAHASQAWTLVQQENPLLAYNPGCPKCSYPGERQYQVVFGYAASGGDGLLPCGLRSQPVPMPPKF